MIALVAQRNAGWLPPWQIVVGGVLIAALILAIAHYRQRRRAADMSQAAMAGGFSFEPAADPFAGSPPPVHLFQVGTRKRYRNLLRGSAGGLDVSIFDYSYVQSAGQHPQAHEQTVAALRFTGATLPAFELRPETIVLKFLAKLGFKDINFDSNPEFSRRYLLRAQDEAAVRALFTPSVLAFFEGLRDKIWVEGAGEWIAVYRWSRKVSPENVRAFADEAAAIASTLKSATAAKFGW